MLSLNISFCDFLLFRIVAGTYWTKNSTRYLDVDKPPIFKLSKLSGNKKRHQLTMIAAHFPLDLKWLARQ
jgi:hypothetical protein